MFVNKGNASGGARSQRGEKKKVEDFRSTDQNNKDIYTDTERQRRGELVQTGEDRWRKALCLRSERKGKKT